MLARASLTINVTSFGLIEKTSLGRSLKSEQMRLLGIKIAKMYTHFGSLDSSGSEALKQVKRFKMDKTALKELTYGAVQELLHNKRYYYKGIGPGYSHWTDEGEKALCEFMNLMGHKMLEVEQADLRELSKKMVIDGLKGEKV